VDGVSVGGGRVVAFLGSLPNVGRGACAPRESARAYGTERERDMFAPAPGAGGEWYRALGVTAAEHGVCVDLNFCGTGWFDAATVGQVAELSGGALRLYRDFLGPAGSAAAEGGGGGAQPQPQQQQQQQQQQQPAPEGAQALVAEFSDSLRRERGFDAMLKVRCSSGVGVASYAGGYVREGEGEDGEVVLAGVDSHTGLLAHLALDGGDMPDGGAVHVQCALLYTTVGGARRVRVFNLALRATGDISQVFRHADIDVVLGALARNAATTAATRDLRFLPTELADAATGVLLSYRRHCAASSQMGQLVLPEPLKLLPLYVNCLLKHPAFALNVAGAGGRGAGGGRASLFADVGVRGDRRAAELAALRGAPHHAAVPMIYPRVYRVDAMVDAVGKLPPITPNTSAADLAGLLAGGAPREPPAHALLRVHLPPAVWPSAEKLDEAGLYLVEAYRCV